MAGTTMLNGSAGFQAKDLGWSAINNADNTTQGGNEDKRPRQSNPTLNASLTLSESTL
jgi:hypothetical protein